MLDLFHELNVRGFNLTVKVMPYWWEVSRHPVILFPPSCQSNSSEGFLNYCFVCFLIDCERNGKSSSDMISRIS